MALTGKKFKDGYKDVLTISNSNNGLTTSAKEVLSGNGNSSAISLSDDQLSVQPTVHNTTTAFEVNNRGGTNVLAVDTTNSEVLANGHYVNTQFKNFGVHDISPSAGSHLAMIAMTGFAATSSTTWAPPDFGTGTDPSTSLTIGAGSYLVTPIYWYLHSNITIDAVFVIASADGSTTANFHLFSYDIVTGSGSTAGDLSNGTLLAHNGTPLALNSDRASTTTMTIDSADVASGKVVIAFVENIGGSDDVSVNMEVKYHLNA